MRKFPKLLAIVLAIAIVICPAMCLTTMAASTATYDLAYEDGVLTVTVSAESGFLVSLLRIDVEGFAIDDEEGITVATKEGRAFSANPAYDDVAGILSLVIAPKEPLDITTVTEATVTIEATELDVAERYYIALTKIQVADAGTAEDPESLLDIAGVAADGTVETVVPTVNRLPHVCEAVAEYVDNGDGTHNGLCECGEVLIENEEHSDENSDLSCDECEATLEAPHSCEVADYVDNGDGTHNGACECGEVLIENEEHSDENADNACDKCDAALEEEVNYVLTYSSASISGLASSITFGYKYTGISFSHPEEIEEFGVLMQCEDNYDEETGVVVDGRKVIPFTFNYTSTYTVRIQNIPLANFGKDYIFVLYAKLTDGTYVYGSEERLSYAEDYLLPRKTAGATVGTTTVSELVAARANAYLAAYYELSGDVAYAEFAATALDQTKNYTSTIAKNTYTNANADPRLTYTGVAVSGLASSITFGYKYTGISFSNPEEIEEFGVLMQCEDNYDASNGVTIDGAKVIKFNFDYTSTYTVRIQNIPLANFGKDYIFVLYAKLTDGTYVYGEYNAINYVGDYLVPRIKNDNAKTASRAIAYIEAYQKLTGTTVYAVS